MPWRPAKQRSSKSGSKEWAHMLTFAHHAGSAKAMESDGAEILWSRSIKKKKTQLRYATFVEDGDSFSYGRVVKLQLCGRNHPTEKEDCVSHVQKCMGALASRSAEVQ